MGSFALMLVDDNVFDVVMEVDMSLLDGGELQNNFETFSQLFSPMPCRLLRSTSEVFMFSVHHQNII